jgi:hypothetical protein
MLQHHPNTDAVWRLPIAFQVVFILLAWATIFFLPESPRYLYACGAVEDADNIMARIYSVPVDGAEVAKDRADVFAALEIGKEYKFSFKNLFYDTSPVNTTWRLWLGVLCQLLQQMDGNNIVSYVGLPFPVLPAFPLPLPFKDGSADEISMRHISSLILSECLKIKPPSPQVA